MKIFAQVLGTDTGDTCPTLLLFFDNKRYLFNCGEGTQRFATEHKPGIILTVTDIGTEKLCICGPKNMASFMESTRFFVARSGLTLNVREFEGTTDVDYFKDENIKVIPIPIKRQVPVAEEAMDVVESSTESAYAPHGRIASSVTVLPDGRTYEILLRPQVKAPRKMTEEGDGATSTTTHARSQGNTVSSDPRPRKVKAFHRNLAVPQPTSISLCYAIHTADIPGKFNSELAQKLGIVGAQRGKLTKGENVILADGTVVKPSDVIPPPTPGFVMMIVDCPSEEYLDSLVEQPRWGDYQGNGNKFPVVSVLHMTPASVIASERYKAWMNKFDDKVEHIIVNRDNCPILAPFKSAATNQLRLHRLHSEIFPKPFVQSEPSIPLTTVTGLPARTRMAEPLLKMHIAPVAQQGIDSTEVVGPLQSYESVFEEMTQVKAYEPFLRHYAELQTELLSHKERNDEMSVDDPFAVTFLGTGSAMPSKYRNVSSTYIEVIGAGGILLDAGEGTLGQLLRVFGAPNVDDLIKRLKCVFVSHMHADHHLGLIRILKRRVALGITEKILIVGPTPYLYWLTELQWVEGDLNFTFVDHLDLMHQPDQPDVAAMKQYLNAALGIEAAVVPVIHCLDAFGITVTHKSGWKIVFSGDTRPCDALIEAGKDCTLLIHEATFEDGMTEEAVDKRHSTTTEAIESATKMNAHFLMMNHFSQRYPKIPVFDQKYTNSTGVAFDLMTVRMRDFPILPKFLNCLQHLFPEEPEEKEAVEPEPRIHTQQVKQKQKQGPSADRASTPNKKSKLVQ